MGARWLGALGIGLAAMAFAGSAHPAIGKPGYLVFPAERENSFSVMGTNGYEITVSHIGRRVELAASRGNAVAVYVVGSGKPSSDGHIEARFPGRGRISVRFQPTGPVRRTPPFYPPACNGGGEIEQAGTFKGTIRFRGEEGFTRLVAGRATGTTHRIFKEVCERGSPDGNSKPKPTYTLSAYASAPGGIISFSAWRPAPGSDLPEEASYFGGSQKRRHGMTTVKVAVADADADTFAVGGPPAQPDSADVAPPRPFVGTASFERTAGRLVWEGTLAVDLPGVDGMRLAGPSFQAQLCVNSRCLNYPIPAAARRWLLDQPGGGMLAQGSGSQSQAFWDDRLPWSR